MIYNQVIPYISSNLNNFLLNVYKQHSMKWKCYINTKCLALCVNDSGIQIINGYYDDAVTLLLDMRSNIVGENRINQGH